MCSLTQPPGAMSAEVMAFAGGDVLVDLVTAFVPVPPAAGLVVLAGGVLVVAAGSVTATVKAVAVSLGAVAVGFVAGTAAMTMAAPA